jgi:hypothetical protein
MGIVLKKDEYKLDPKPLVKLVMSRFFGETSAGMVDALVAHLPSPEDGAKAKIEQTYSGSADPNPNPNPNPQPLTLTPTPTPTPTANPNPNPNPTQALSKRTSFRGCSHATPTPC